MDPYISDMDEWIPDNWIKVDSAFMYITIVLALLCFIKIFIKINISGNNNKFFFTSLIGGQCEK